MKHTLEQILQGLVDGADDGFLDNSKLTVVETKWVSKIKGHLKKSKKARDKQSKRESLRAEREVKADVEFAKASKRTLDIPEEATVEESDGWELDGEDRLLKKFYYVNIAGDELNNTSIGTFVVDFKPNSVKVADVHSNT